MNKILSGNRRSLMSVVKPDLVWRKEPIALEFDWSKWGFNFIDSINHLHDPEQFILHRFGISISTPNKEDERRFWKSGDIDLIIGGSKEYLLRQISLDLFNPDIQMPNPVPKGVRAWEKFRKLISELNLTRYYSVLTTYNNEKFPFLIEPGNELYGKLFLNDKNLKKPNELKITLFMCGLRGKVK